MPDTLPDVDRPRSIREISQRVDGDSHRRPSRFGQRVRWLSGLAFLIIFLGLTLAAVLGERRIYEAGEVSSAHRFIGNDCAMCHETWTPVAKLSSGNSNVSSVAEEKCASCHAGPAHYAGQQPAHAHLHCGTCHREHRGEEVLIAHANVHCIACHKDLTAYTENMAGPQDAAQRELSCAVALTSFSADHPEFAVLSVRDTTPLRFNHKLHLHAKYDAAGELVEGILNEKGELEDLSRDCSVCHEPDTNRQYIRPLRYEAHCSRCHPLFFDRENFPGRTVPHGVESPILRGFLTQLYTTRALREPGSLRAPSQLRPLPGHTAAAALTPSAAAAVADDVAAAEEQLAGQIARSLEEAQLLQQQGVHALFGEEALGGCRLCHQLNQVQGSPTSVAGGTDYVVEHPEIPARWLDRAVFSHDSHRFLQCESCHQDFSVEPPRPVTESDDTGDVLLPSIHVCRNCHGDESSSLFSFAAEPPGARVKSRCTDCHIYHDRTNERFPGMLDVGLTLGNSAEENR